MMREKTELSPPHPAIRTYRRDRRISVNMVYRRCRDFAARCAWPITQPFVQKVTRPGRATLHFPILGLHTRHRGPALWLLAGIHGEEPAGVVAVIRQLKVLRDLAAAGIPVVLLPLCNPAGYFRNWRYPAHPSAWSASGSVGDTEHLLPRSPRSRRPRRCQPSCDDSDRFSAWALKMARAFPPRLVIDLHEDDTIGFPYIYSQGRAGDRDPIAIEVRRILSAPRKHSQPVPRLTRTTLGEEVKHGIVCGVQDSSIDELLAAKSMIRHGRRRCGPQAPHVIVIESPMGRSGLSVAERAAIHEKVITALPRLWAKAAV